MNNNIVNPSNFDINKITFSNPDIVQIPNSKVCFKRIRFLYEYDGDVGDLIISSPASLKCWGMKEDRDRITDKLTGYTLVINLTSNNNVSDEEQAFLDCLENICNQTKNHLVENRNKIERYDLDKGDLKKLSPIYYPMEKGEKIPGKAPKLYAKCMYSKKDNLIMTSFIDMNDMKTIDPCLTINRESKSCLLERKGFSFDVQFAIKVESIYIGNCISLQLKLTEVGFKIPHSLLDLKSALFGVSLDWRNKSNSELTFDSVKDESIETDSYTQLTTGDESEEEITYIEEEQDVMEENEEPPVEIVKPLSPPIIKSTKRKGSKKITA